MSEKYEINLASLPDKPGVYLMYNKDGKVIYVGKAINLKNRVKSYFQNRDQGTKVRVLVDNIAFYDYIVTDNEVEALILESTLIKKFKPRYNVLLKDDRELPYIKVTLQDKYPQVIASKKLVKDGSKYYGPYPTASAMHEVISLAEKLFPIKYCEVPVYKDRPCLYYHMKQCLAPCISWGSPEEHKRMIADVCLFLEGKTVNYIDKLTEEMEKASERLDFERAAQVRDTIRSLSRYMEKQKVVTKPGIEHDIIGTHISEATICFEIFQVRDGKLIGKLDFNYPFTETDTLKAFISTFITEYYQKTENIPSEIILEILPDDPEILEHWLTEKKNRKVFFTVPAKGHKKDLLEMVIKNAMIYMDRLKSDHNFQVSRKGMTELKEYLGMTELPRKIEGFDISHVQGTNTVASQVVFENGEPKKSEYRKYKINFSEGSPNDFASMYEVVYRRYKRVLEEELEQPELILIDGGKGQLGMAVKALNDLNYPYKAIIGLAKRLEEVFVPGQKEPIILPANSFSLKLIQNVRDEAHRFAVTFHRKLRSKGMIASALDEIPGIGSKRKKQLMEKFGSLNKIYEASLQDLIFHGNLPKNVAETLYNKLRMS